MKSEDRRLMAEEEAKKKAKKADEKKPETKAETKPEAKTETAPVSDTDKKLDKLLEISKNTLTRLGNVEKQLQEQEDAKTVPPVQEPPVTQEPPKAEPPVTQEPPVQEPPKAEPPVTQEPPVQEPPKAEPPVTQEPPVQEPPKAEPPKQQQQKKGFPFILDHAYIFWNANAGCWDVTTDIWKAKNQGYYYPRWAAYNPEDHTLNHLLTQEEERKYLP